VSDNPDLASATGINTQQVIRMVWVLAGGLAALGGIFRALDEQVGFDMGSRLLFLMFASITLGGLGSAFGHSSAVSSWVSSSSSPRWWCRAS
jgi:branched-chain amino acid transport system permease protein